MTVPVGMPITSPSSRYDRPSNSRSTSNSRKRTGKLLMARSSNLRPSACNSNVSGSSIVLSLAVLLFIEQVGGRLEAVAAPASARVAHDSEEPGAAISADECPKISKRSQRRLLHGIFSIRVVPHQPTRQPIGRIEVGKDDLFKGLASCRHSRCAGESVIRTALRVWVECHATSVEAERADEHPQWSVQRPYDARTGGGKMREA